VREGHEADLAASLRTAAGALVRATHRLAARE
jgi:hypothetical protein